MKSMMNLFRRRQEGQGMAEYALILGLIAVIAIVAVRLLGTKIVEVFNNIVSALG